MKKIFYILILVFSTILVFAEPSQTTEFMRFARSFFKDAEYQKNHIQFPLEFRHYVEGKNGYEVEEIQIKIAGWKHLEGPNYYKCEINCYDIVIYDNFEKKYKHSNKRVLSFEGSGNGISSSLYFENIDGEWYLVRYEKFDL